jgi:molybdopterin-guanine dinucleotide biosynthesis protein
LLEYCKAEVEANRDIAEALINALVEAGTLSGLEIDAIISHEIAVRSLRLEHQRRDDWRGREASAALFNAEVAPDAWVRPDDDDRRYRLLRRHRR